MAITNIDLDNVALEDIRVLIHSIRAGGKTHLLGDMLSHEAAFGPVAYVNTAGEGLMTIKGTGLGKNGYVIDNLADFKGLMKTFTDKPLHAMGLDSLQVLERFVILSVVGTADRSPTSTKDKNEWVDIAREFNNALSSMWRATRLLMCTAPSAINMDPITNNPRVISPDLSGQRALGCAGYFEYVGYIKMLVSGPGLVKRSVQFAPDGVTLVRQQIPNAIVKDIPIPDGPGGWVAIKDAIQKGMETNVKSK
jgi:hypothetical protein